MVFAEAIAFLNAFFLFSSVGFIAFELVSPLLARLILPLIIWILEFVRLLLFLPQFIIEQIVIWLTTDYFLYPKDEGA